MTLNNTATRIVVSVIAIPALLLMAYFGKVYFLSFVLIVAGISFYEFAVMAKKKNANVNVYPGLITIIILILNQYINYFSQYYFLIIAFLILLIIELFRNYDSAILNLGSTLLGIFYFGLFGSSLLGIREFYPDSTGFYINGGYLIISVFASIWICDSAAFFGGTALGKHKLFPRVSPKKSWEGAVFGFVFAILTMIAAKYLVLDFLTLKDVIIIGFIIGTFGQTGDLVESLMKRDAAVKDSSNLIPGHGGIFDRFDSLLFSSPIIYLYLTYLS
ncbi:MAG: phosphatidate cytidylyltransferase [Ignavibacteriaceae bacterium]|jgi:phosphatidate cytidylyltransferase|nr:phosphatidate cytidylyltransferase [Ignavibacteriaceae bacterium]